MENDAPITAPIAKLILRKRLLTVQDCRITDVLVKLICVVEISNKEKKLSYIIES